MYNSLHVKALRKALDQMKKAQAVFGEYCTEDCEHCPLYRKNVCGYYLEIDPSADVSDGLLNDFVDFHDGKEYADEPMWVDERRRK